MVEVKPYPLQASRRPVKVHPVKAGHQPIDGILGAPKGGEGNPPRGVLWAMVTRRKTLRPQSLLQILLSSSVPQV